MKEYVITYRESYVGAGGWLEGGEKETFRCTAKSKSKALKRLINLEPVHRVYKIRRVK